MEAEKTQTSTPNTAFFPSGNRYELPYANSVIESFLTVAENASRQVNINESACKKAMTDNENTMSDIMPAFPQMQENYTSSIVYSTRSLMLSAESAYQAQSSVCEALNSAIKVAQEERTKLKNRLTELAVETSELEKRTLELRQAFKSAADNRSTPTTDVYATEEAKKLLSVLEAAYQKHELSQKLNKYLAETDANLSYLLQSELDAKSHMAEIAELAQRARDEWKLVRELFKVSPGTFENQAETMAVFQEQMKTKLEKKMAETTAADTTEPEPPVIQEKEESRQRPSAWAMIWSYLKIIIVAFLIAFVLRAYVFDITMVDGTSMYPTLEDRDKLITVKLTYHFSEPQRGDIVVVNAPDMPGHDYIKRVIGLPNERITIRDGQVYINDELLTEPYLDDVATYGDTDMVIPDGYYFVMGDNRTDSRDSREEKIGVISKDDINGKAVFRLLPLSEIGSLY